MFPKTYTDKTQCLSSLVGIRSQCSVPNQYPFWIEDIEGVDVKKLSSMSKASNPNGKDFGNQLIDIAARQMMGDLELLLNNGYRLNNIVGDMCSSCQLLPVYTTNAGIIVKSTVATRFSILRVTRLTILADFTGEKQLTFDDGVEPKFYSVTLTAGLLVPVVLDYSTTQKSVKIYFTDNTVPVGQVYCTTPTSCGCGGSATSNNPISISGLSGGIEGSTQYGFLPCAGVECSHDTLVCNLIKQAPNIFGLTMFYKVGQLYYDNKRVSDRSNDAVSFNEEQTEEMPNNYSRLYWAKMKGTGGMMGINKIVNDYLKTNRSDKCVLCDAKIFTAYATG